MIRIRSAAAAALAAVGLVAAGPATAALETLKEVEDCVQANMPDESSVQTVVMNAHDRIGSVTQTRARIYWKKFDELSKVLVRLSDPPEMRGAAILMLETEGDRDNDILMFLPELNRVKRVTGHMMSGSMFGTDFSYEDFESLQGLSNDDFERSLAPPAELGGRPVYVIQAVARKDVEEPPTYERTLTYVDQEWCVPLKVEFFERGDEPRKRLETDPSQVKQAGSRHVAHRMEIRDLRDQTRTELVVEDIDFDQKVSRSMFTTQALEKFGGRTF